MLSKIWRRRSTRLLLCGILVGLSVTGTVWGLDFPQVVRVERQPLIAATQRLMEALDFVGAPLNREEKERLQAAFRAEEERTVVAEIQAVLDPHCLAGVHINPESRVKVSVGPVKKELVEQGWRSFLVKVHNEAGINPPLDLESPQTLPVYERGTGTRQRPRTDQQLVEQADVIQRFLDVSEFRSQPLTPKLSGLGLEYRIFHLYSRDAGQREAQIGFNVGQGTQDLGFRNSVPILFQVLPAKTVHLGIKDHDGRGTTAAIVVKDAWGRIYPNPAKRLAPDFFFHEQVYRNDGESLSLPPGNYTALVTRGPEYLPTRQEFVVDDASEQRVAFELTRWIHPARSGWASGDHHVHAAGCAHYDSPTEGVGPADMLRHILGEDLNVGCVLSWGPCWYTQKQFFEGATSALSTADNLMRYDVEVSGFPSSHAGHLCLLNLKDDEYPGTSLIEEWPSWTLPVLKWGKEQGGIVGYSHSGWGLGLPDYAPDGSRLETINYPNRARQQGLAACKLPDYAMPPFDGIGANEFIVTAVHDVCDFISAVDTPAIWELNIWYHTLNCGLRTRISGETDFPCIYGERVGLGRVYVKVPQDEPLNFETWVEGLKRGRSYCGDGMSHLMDFEINDVQLGEPGTNGEISQLNLPEPGTVRVKVQAAALLEEEQTDFTRSIKTRRLDQKPYWHIERARIGETRHVPVELVVNGEVQKRYVLEANGETEEIELEAEIEQSSWVALRIFPSCHTNPIFIQVGEEPIRANRQSAAWCRRAVDVCWESKQERIRPEERSAAAAAYDVARRYYDAILQALPEE